MQRSFIIKFQSNLKTYYTYNGQSLLKSSNSMLFGETLFYNDLYGNSTPCYNGNISAMNWRINGDKLRGYLFSYDKLSRLSAAGYLENGISNNNYSTSYAYDKQGNITTLNRRGATGTTTFGVIDNLTMTYIGNKLIKADDSGENVSLSASMDFKDGANAPIEYFYDANGNLIKDLNKGITNITYNLLNLPRTLAISNSMGTATNTYTYAADGRKLRVVQQGNGSSKQIDYCGNMIYENGTLKRILVEGGYIEAGIYYFYLNDHLGNVREVANADGNIVQTNHYYPFGMSFSEGNISSKQPYKYNGKELDTERGLYWYDYGARMYDPALGRWHVADLMEDIKPWASDYMYCLDNPEKYIDPTGLYETQADALKYAKEHGFAKVLQDAQTGKWFVSMDASGKNPYTTGGTVTRIFGSESSSNWMGSLNIGLSAWNVGVTTQREMFNWAVRDYSHLSYNEFKALDKGAQVIKEEEALGEAGAKYLKGTKMLGKASTIANIFITGKQVSDDINDHRYISAGARVTVFLFTEGTAFIPFAGPFISAGMGLLDATYGDRFYDHLQNKFGN